MVSRESECEEGETKGGAEREEEEEYLRDFSLCSVGGEKHPERWFLGTQRRVLSVYRYTDSLLDTIINLSMVFYLE